MMFLGGYCPISPNKQDYHVDEGFHFCEDFTHIPPIEHVKHAQKKLLKVIMLDKGQSHVRCVISWVIFLW